MDCPFDCNCQAAADEIARLQGEVARLQGILDFVNAANKLQDNGQLAQDGKDAG